MDQIYLVVCMATDPESSEFVDSLVNILGCTQLADGFVTNLARVYLAVCLGTMAHVQLVTYVVCGNMFLKFGRILWVVFLYYDTNWAAFSWLPA